LTDYIILPLSSEKKYLNEQGFVAYSFQTQIPFSNMSAPSNTENQSQPSQIVGNIKQYAGLAEESIGNAIGNQSWTDAGKELREQGLKEIKEAKDAVASAFPNKTNANLNSVTGGIKEEVGNLVGNSNLANSGAEQREAGHTEYQAAKAGEYLEGVGNTVRGKVEGAVGKAVGDQEAQVRAQLMQQEGKKAMDLNEPK
jgi:uncharacterized protein YjbJ (UPF0337 family)